MITLLARKFKGGVMDKKQKNRQELERAERILRAVTWGERSHRAALWLIQQAQTRHEAAPLRELVRTSV